MKAYANYICEGMGILSFSLPLTCSSLPLTFIAGWHYSIQQIGKCQQASIWVFEVIMWHKLVK